MRKHDSREDKGALEKMRERFAERFKDATRIRSTRTQHDNHIDANSRNRRTPRAIFQAASSYVQFIDHGRRQTGCASAAQDSSSMKRGNLSIQREVHADGGRNGGNDNGDAYTEGSNFVDYNDDIGIGVDIPGKSVPLNS